MRVDDVVVGGELVFPAGLAILPDGGLLVASLESGELLHYDLPPGGRGFRATLPDGARPASRWTEFDGRSDTRAHGGPLPFLAELKGRCLVHGARNDDYRSQRPDR